MSNLINQLNNENYFEKIPQKVKNTFNINEIKDDILLIGFQPKILINEDENKSINGYFKFIMKKKIIKLIFKLII